MVILRVMIALRRLSRAMAVLASLALLGGSSAGLACAWICGGSADRAAREAPGVASAAEPAGASVCHGHASMAGGPVVDRACCRTIGSSVDVFGPGAPGPVASPPRAGARISIAPTVLAPGFPRSGLSGGSSGIARRPPLRI
jgi:hypothetical protein